MANTRVDVTLALRTLLSGNAEGLAYLDQFEKQAKKTATGTSNEWDRLARKLERKFSLPDIAGDLLKGFGIGSGFAIVSRSVDSFFRGFEERAKAAAEEAKNFKTELDGVIASAEKLAAGRITDWIESLAPGSRIEAKKKEIQSLTDQIAEEQRKQKQAADNIEAANTTGGRLMTMIRGSAEEGNWDNVLNGAQARKDVPEWAKKQVDDQLAAAARILELEAARDQLVKGIARDEKQIADDKKKAAEDERKAAAESLQARKKNAEEQAKTDPATLGRRIAEDFIKKAGEKDKALERSAQAYREMAAPQEIFARKEREIQELLATGKLTTDQAAAAMAQLKSEFGQDLRRAIDASNDALRGFGAALVAIDNSPTMSDVQKRAARVELLKKENLEIERQVGLLREFGDKQPGIDPAALSGQIRGLQDRAVSNDAAITKPEISRRDRAGLDNRNLDDPTQHFQTFGEGAEGGLLDTLTQFGTQADLVADGIRNSLGGAVSGVTSGIKGWLTSTQTAGQAWANLKSGILDSMLSTIVNMGAQWLLNSILIKTGMISIEATGDALRASRVVKENAAELATLPAKTAGAAASGISSFGVALIFGALAVAMIAGLAGAFADGGPVSGAGGPREDKIFARLSNGEYVQTAAVAQSSKPEHRFLMAWNEAARKGKSMPAFADGGFVSGLEQAASSMAAPALVMTQPAFVRPSGGGSASESPGSADQAQTSRRGDIYVYDDEAAAQRAKRDDEDGQFIRMMDKHRYRWRI